jgi:WD40 repeat protein/predicted Ser/Thr protein kinase/DNA-directed RNA polymerase subunit RPC12/RpoP
MQDGFVYNCPRCSTALRVKNAWIGRYASCKRCGGKFKIPAPQEATVMRPPPSRSQVRPMPVPVSAAGAHSGKLPVLPPPSLPGGPVTPNPNNPNPVPNPDALATDAIPLSSARSSGHIPLSPSDRKAESGLEVPELPDPDAPPPAGDLQAGDLQTDDLQSVPPQVDAPPPRSVAPESDGPESGPRRSDVPESVAPEDLFPSLRTERIAPRGADDPSAPPTVDGGDGGSSTGSQIPAATGRPEIRGYQIVGELGRGGMGVVYKAKQTGLGRTVALKMILAGAHAGREELARFRAEAGAVARLSHPNIVQVHEIGEHEGRPFFSLEYVDGGSLHQKLDGGALAPARAARLAEQLARAVHYAHQRGIVHRDLKPANVLLAADGTPKLTDFGLAKIADADAGVQTRTGAVMGTPSYMAPEQADGKTRDIGPPADVYALGAILYDMLTGRPPFRGQTQLDTLYQVISAEPVPPTRLRRTIPADLEVICLKCLEKSPDRRYPSAHELAEDLRRFLAGEAISARPAGTVERLGKWLRRHPLRAALAGVSVLALLAGALWYDAEIRARAAEARRAADEADAKTRQAEADRLKAEEIGRLAAERESLSRRHLYAAHMTLAQQAWSDGQIGRLKELLEGCRPGPAADRNGDLRGFEWYYLDRLCRTERAVLPAFAGRINAVALSADAEVVGAVSVEVRRDAEAAPDAGIRLWNLKDRTEMMSAPGHEGGTTAIAFHPGKAFFATTGHDGLVKVWNYRGETVCTAKGHKGPVSGVAFHPGGEFLASGGADGTVRFWRTYQGTPHGQSLKSAAEVACVAYHPGGRWLATGGYDNQIHIWDWETATHLAALTGHTAAVTCLAFSRDGRMLLSGGQDAAARLWEIPADDTSRRPSYRARGAFTGHANAVYSVGFAPDAESVVTASWDGTVRLWQVKGRALGVLKGESGGVMSAVFTPDGGTILSGGEDGVVRIREAAAAEESLDLPGHSGAVEAVAVSADGATSVSGSADGKLIFRSVPEGAVRQTVGSRLSGIRGVALVNRGGLMAVADSDGSVRIRTAAGDRELHVCEGHRGPATAVAFSPAGSLLASVGADGTLRLWNPDSGRAEGAEIAVSDRPLQAVAFDTRGALIAVAGDDGKVRLYDAGKRTPADTFEGAVGEIRSLAFSPDGRWLAAGSGRPGRSGEVRLWALDSHKLHAVLPGHAGPVRALAFTPDGRTLVSGGLDGLLVLWDPLVAQPRLRLPGHEGGVMSAAFTPDGRTLVTAGGDRMVRYWRTEKEPAAGSRR